MDIVLPEIIAAGIYNSKAVIKNKTVTKNRKTTMFEIELPIEKGGISYINSEKADIDETLIICAKPGQTRHTHLPFKCYYIHMILKEGILYDILINAPDFIKVSDPKEYYDIFKELCRYFGTAPQNDKIMLNSLVLKLVYKLYEAAKKQTYQYKAKKNNDIIIEKALSFIKANLTENITLEKVANHVSFSPVYFHNCFKSATGKTLHEYVEEQRITKAADLLVTTDKTLAEIAYLCGFSSQSYFSYSFKRKMQMTPREYVKKICSRYDCLNE
ncbi:MAG: AraC family transcriptional regulator [Clostridiales bacterium]|nr:AraC family transcriptional regulator [Clostridiales bacterium]